MDLYGAVDPAASKFEILGTKVEIRLRKAESVHWPGLEAGAGKQPFKTFAPPPTQAPAYPSSFKRCVLRRSLGPRTRGVIAGKLAHNKMGDRGMRVLQAAG